MDKQPLWSLSFLTWPVKQILKGAKMYRSTNIFLAKFCSIKRFFFTKYFFLLLIFDFLTLENISVNYCIPQVDI